jgi:hypothetical protein
MFTSPEGGDATLQGNEERKERAMPQIIVTADTADEQGEGAVMLRERINVSDFESNTFGQRLVERLGWAVGDAQEAERQTAENGDPGEPTDYSRSASVVTTAS